MRVPSAVTSGTTAGCHACADSAVQMPCSTPQLVSRAFVLIEALSAGQSVGPQMDCCSSYETHLVLFVPQILQDDKCRLHLWVLQTTDRPSIMMLSVTYALCLRNVRNAFASVMNHLKTLSTALTSTCLAAAGVRFHRKRASSLRRRTWS